MFIWIARCLCMQENIFNSGIHAEFKCIPNVPIKKINFQIDLLELFAKDSLVRFKQFLFETFLKVLQSY